MFASRLDEVWVHVYLKKNTVLIPLRKRREDILIIAEYYLNKYRGQIGLEAKKLTPRQGTKLMQYDWPGNICERRNAIERSVIMNDELIWIYSSDGLMREERGNSAFKEVLLDMKYKKVKEKVPDEFRKFYFEKTIKRFGGNVTIAAEEGQPREPV